MTDTDLRNSVNDLDSTVDRLTRAVDHQAESATSLSHQVNESNTRAMRDRKILRILTGLVVFKLMTLLVLGVVIVSLKDTNKTINDCVSPDGKCAQRNAQVLAITTDGLAYRGELQRLKTELPISELKDDQVRVDEIKKRIVELEGQIDQANARIAAIRQQIKGAQ